jgi:phosphate transport system protein
MAKRHTDREYEAELNEVRENLIEMTSRVREMIGNSVKALLSGDLDQARTVIEEDRMVNRLEVDTDDLCLLILAKRQPMASDLRFITLAMKMVTDLERIGDLAVNISERALALDGYDAQIVGPMIKSMGDINMELISDAMQSFVDSDAAKAESLSKRDAEVDNLYLEACNVVQGKMHADTDYVDPGVHLQAAAKFLERIGDHITNLAELVIFMVKGKDIRHLASRKRKTSAPPPIAGADEA